MRSLVPRALPVFVALLLGAAAQAAPTPVKVEIPIVRPIQTYTLGQEGAQAEDEIYLLASGVANGQEFNKRIPEQGTVKAAPKTPPFEGKPPRSGRATSTTANSPTSPSCSCRAAARTRRS